MITSALSGEGKSVTTLQLARALARADAVSRSSTSICGAGAHDARGARRPARDHVRRPGECSSPTPSSRSRSTRWTRPALPADTNGRRDVGAFPRGRRLGASSRPSVRDLELDWCRRGSCRAEQRADVVLVEAAPVLDFPDAAAVAPRPGRAPPRRERSGRPRAVLAEVRRAVEAGRSSGSGSRSPMAAKRDCTAGRRASACSERGRRRARRSRCCEEHHRSSSVVQ